MKKERFPVAHETIVALCLAFLLSEVAQAQISLPSFIGTFSLNAPTQWSQTVLPPGKYTITIEAANAPVIALVRDERGRPVARFVSGIDGGEPTAVNALLVKEKNGRFCVHSLSLASLRKVLVYDPALAREAALEAHATRNASVLLAKK